MRIDILTIFPNMIEPVIKESIIGRAIYEKKVEINVVDFRLFSKNKHKKVDDYPYGGGAGMVLTVQPVIDALKSINGYEKAHKILMSPQGDTHTHALATSLSKVEHLIILCGHYEGFDERIRSYFDQEISIGDYVLTGGEMAALVVVDSVIRLIPEVLNNAASHQQDSFADGLLEHPHYTRPQTYDNQEVPGILLSGNHAKIEAWRLEASLKRTKTRRPDLYEKYKKKQQK